MKQAEALQNLYKYFYILYQINEVGQHIIIIVVVGVVGVVGVGGVGGGVGGGIGGVVDLRRLRPLRPLSHLRPSVGPSVRRSVGRPDGRRRPSSVIYQNNSKHIRIFRMTQNLLGFKELQSNRPKEAQ